jgi:hypothetical protein
MKRYWDKPKYFTWETRWFLLQIGISGDWLWSNTQTATAFEERTHYFTISKVSRGDLTAVSVIILPVSIMFGLV